MPWTRGSAAILAALGSPVQSATRDYWCSPALQNGMPTWLSSSGWRHQCILIKNLSWCCSEAAVSVCLWHGPLGAACLVSSCLQSTIPTSIITNLRNNRASFRRIAELNSKIVFHFPCLKPCTKQLLNLPGNASTQRGCVFFLSHLNVHCKSIP